jgi:hypothetical protein
LGRYSAQGRFSIALARWQSLAATHIGAFGLYRIERDQRCVRDSLCQGNLVARALEERYADHDAVTDDQCGQLALLYVGEAGSDPDTLLGERLTAGKAEVGAAFDEAGEAVWVLGLYIAEETVGPIARIGLHQTRLLARLQTYALGDDVRCFAGAQQRAAPQDHEWMSACALGEIGGLLASGVVQRHRQVALEATL